MAGRESMKQTPLRKISNKQAAKNKVWKQIVQEIITGPADYKCEIRWEGCWINRQLGGHHIIKKSQLGENTKENCIIGCPNCHNHHRWAEGIPLSREEARERIAYRL